MLCRQQVAELAEHQHEFTENNLHLVVIGFGKPEALPSFRDVTGYRGTLLTDQSRQAFGGLGFGNSVGGLIGWRPVADALKALQAGFRPGRLQGSGLQLGGALVIDTDGTILYLHREKKAGDHPPVAQLLEPHVAP